MIPKAPLLALAKAESVLPTTMEKDYVLGWLLCGIALNPVASKWVFKGGTCLKKCFFETYRFSEDLDFTVPSGEPLNESLIATSLREICEWVEQESGIAFPAGDLKTEEYTNKQGTQSFNAKLSYSGPLKMARHSLQRVKFDITQQELLVDAPTLRGVFHRYGDSPEPMPQVNCYSVNEILAEKTRALYERQGRARDVYDVVHINRAFRREVDADRARDIAEKKFSFKGLPSPTVNRILDRIDSAVLKSDWEHQLAHQLPAIPSVDAFEKELPEALTWWLEPEQAAPPLATVSLKSNEKTLPQQHFPRTRVSADRIGALEGDSLDRIRLAAHNRLCVELTYHGVTRIVEPYSLRRSTQGNLLLYAHERRRGVRPTGHIKAYKVREILDAQVNSETFTPRWAVEL